MARVTLGSIPAIKYIIGYEIAESFSYYGIRSILAMYLHHLMGYSHDNAVAVIHSFIFLSCIFSLVNGIIADAWSGKYAMILQMSFLYTGGATLLAVSSSPGVVDFGAGERPPAWAMYAGLAMVAAGVGGINPCLSSFVGDQFVGAHEESLSSLYHLFYLSVNIGSILAFFSIPLLRDRVNVSAAFGVPAGLFFLATIAFFMGRRHYNTSAVRSNPIREMWTVVTVARRERRDAEARGEFVNHTPLLDFAKPVCGLQAVENVRAVMGILRVFAPLPVFWALYDQQTSRWVFMAQRMDRMAGGYEFAPDQLNTLNPFLLLVLIPLFDNVVYPMLRKCGFRMRPLARMGIGMLFTAASFFLAGSLQARIDAEGDGEVPIANMIPQYLLLSSGEIMLSITGLEFAYSQAPRTVKSAIMAIWFLTAAVGNLLVAAFAHQPWFASEAEEFYFYGFLMLLFFVIFVLVAWSYRYRTLVDEYGSGRGPGAPAPTDPYDRSAVPTRHPHGHHRDSSRHHRSRGHRSSGRSGGGGGGGNGRRDHRGHPPTSASMPSSSMPSSSLSSSSSSSSLSPPPPQTSSHSSAAPYLSEKRSGGKKDRSSSRREREREEKQRKERERIRGQSRSGGRRDSFDTAERTPLTHGAI